MKRQARAGKRGAKPSTIAMPTLAQLARGETDNGAAQLRLETDIAVEIATVLAAIGTPEAVAVIADLAEARERLTAVIERAGLVLLAATPPANAIAS